VEKISARKTTTLQPPDAPATPRPDFKSVIRRTIASIVDNVNIDMAFLRELKARRIINDQILVDIMGRTNRTQRVLRLCAHLLNLGPYALRETGDAMAKYGYPGLASILKREL